MALWVQKFGGSSLTNLTKVEAIARRIKNDTGKGHQIVVVLSALQGETDRLIGLANLVSPEPPKREYDALLATGEQASACLMVMALQRIGVKARSLNAWQARITTDQHHKRASITSIDKPKILSIVRANTVPVITGFQGVGQENSITTLGRGGSDTTALAVAACLRADECQIFVDVGGVYTTDPKIEPNAKLLPSLSIEQLLAHACSGAKVMQKRSVALASRYRVPMRICPTFTDGVGTVIEYQNTNALEKTEVRAIAFAKNQVMLQICVTATQFQDLQALLKCIEKSGLEMEHSIRQNMQNHTHPGDYELSCLLNNEDFCCFKQALDTWLTEKSPLDYRVIREVAKVSLLGYCMTRNMDITHKIIEIGKNFQIDFHTLQGSDQQITMVIAQKHLEILVRKMHQQFKLDRILVQKDARCDATT